MVCMTIEGILLTSGGGRLPSSVACETPRVIHGLSTLVTGIRPWSSFPDGSTTVTRALLVPLRIPAHAILLSRILFKPVAFRFGRVWWRVLELESRRCKFYSQRAAYRCVLSSGKILFFLSFDMFRLKMIFSR